MQWRLRFAGLSGSDEFNVFPILHVNIIHVLRQRMLIVRPARLPHAAGAVANRRDGQRVAHHHAARHRTTKQRDQRHEGERREAAEGAFRRRNDQMLSDYVSTQQLPPMIDLSLPSNKDRCATSSSAAVPLLEKMYIPPPSDTRMRFTVCTTAGTSCGCS